MATQKKSELEETQLKKLDLSRKPSTKWVFNDYILL